MRIIETKENFKEFKELFSNHSSIIIPIFMDIHKHPSKNDGLIETLFTWETDRGKTEREKKSIFSDFFQFLEGPGLPKIEPKSRKIEKKTEKIETKKTHVF